MIAYDMVWDVSDIIDVMEVLSRDFKGSMTVMWYHILSVISYDSIWHGMRCKWYHRCNGGMEQRLGSMIIMWYHILSVISCDSIWHGMRC